MPRTYDLVYELSSRVDLFKIGNTYSLPKLIQRGYAAECMHSPELEAMECCQIRISDSTAEISRRAWTTIRIQTVTYSINRKFTPSSDTNGQAILLDTLLAAAVVASG